MKLKCAQPPTKSFYKFNRVEATKLVSEAFPNFTLAESISLVNTFFEPNREFPWPSRIVKPTGLQLRKLAAALVTCGVELLYNGIPSPPKKTVISKKDDEKIKSLVNKLIGSQPVSTLPTSKPKKKYAAKDELLECLEESVGHCVELGYYNTSARISFILEEVKKLNAA